MRLLWCRGFPAFPGDRRGKPWGKGTQATPLLSNGESKEGSDTYFIKWHDFRRLHSTGEDLFYYCCFETRRVTELGVWEVGDIVCLQLLAAASVWLQPLARPKKASFDLSRLFCSLGDVCVCTLFFLPLFFLFTWQGLRQMLLNILFQWEWGTRVAVGVCCLPRWRHASAVLLSPSVSILLSSLRTEVCRGGINFVWYLSGSSRVWSGIWLPCEDDVVKWNPVTKTDGANLESVCKILQHLIKMVV